MSTLQEQIEEIIYSEPEMGLIQVKALLKLFKRQMLKKTENILWLARYGKNKPNPSLQDEQTEIDRLQAQLRQEVEKLC